MDTELRVVLITVPPGIFGGRVRKIARTLVREQLCACVNFIRAPVTSWYRWQGKVQSSNECLLICKTTKSCVNGLIERVKSLHPYSVPEIISLPITEGLNAYCQWIIDETKHQDNLLPK